VSDEILRDPFRALLLDVRRGQSALGFAHEFRRRSS